MSKSGPAGFLDFIDSPEERIVERSESGFVNYIKEHEAPERAGSKVRGCNYSSFLHYGTVRKQLPEAVRKSQGVYCCLYE